jgi:DNA repair protein RadC
VAVLLGTGVRARNALAVAQDVLVAARNAGGLTRLGLDELRRVPGVGASRAARILAAVELGRRTIMREAGERPQLSTPEAVGRYLLPIFGGHREERFGVVMLDAKNRLIRAELISVGTVDASLAHPREVFRAATVASASSIAVFHNHPSGDPRPSDDDVALTRQLVGAGDVMGIRVVDHIILGDGRWFSFRAARLL